MQTVFVDRMIDKIFPDKQKILLILKNLVNHVNAYGETIN